MKRLFLKMTAAAAVGALLGACGGTDEGDDQTAGTLLQVAARSGEISALVAVARKAGLEDELNAPGANLTVLAPTNEAFSLLAGQLGFTTIQALIDALSAAQLESILRYHVLPTVVRRADLVAGGPSQDTLLQQSGTTVRLAVDTTSGVDFTDAIGRLSIGNVFDLPADNGIFHLIDRVLIPAGVLTVLQTVQSDPERFQQLANTVGFTQGIPAGRALVATLNGAGPLTLFAPVDAAFTAAATLLGTLTQDEVVTVLQYHALGQRVLSSAIPFGTPVATLAGGQTITINTATAPALARIDDTTATDANVTVVDIIASNGVVHVIDKVLLPTLP